MEFNLLAAIPLVVGLVFVLAAILERGYKTFLQEKQTNPNLKFDHIYLVNLWISTGMSAVLVAAASALLTALPQGGDVAITLYGIVITAILGYTTAYTILDKMNTSTENKIIANKAAIAAATTAENK